MTLKFKIRLILNPIWIYILKNVNCELWIKIYWKIRLHLKFKNIIHRKLYVLTLINLFQTHSSLLILNAYSKRKINVFKNTKFDNNCDNSRAKKLKRILIFMGLSFIGKINFSCLSNQGKLFMESEIIKLE